MQRLLIETIYLVGKIFTYRNEQCMFTKKKYNKSFKVARKKRRQEATENRAACFNSGVSMRAWVISKGFRNAVSVWSLLYCPSSAAANATGLGLGLFGAAILFVLTALAVVVKYLIFPLFCAYVCYLAARKTRIFGNLVSLGSQWQTKYPVLESALEAAKKHKYISSAAGLLLWGFLVYLVTDGFSKL